MATAAERMTRNHRPTSLARLWAAWRSERHEHAGQAFQQMDRDKARAQRSR